MNWIEVILLAIVEGLTEFLPVSSTGHMILASALFRIEQTDFLGSYQIVIQVGAILAILSKYWGLLWQRKDYWLLLLVAFIPTSLIGFFGYSLLKDFFLGNVPITMVGLLLGGVVLLLMELYTAGAQTLDTLSLKKASFIGLLQALAIVPGVSRSASTIIGGRIVGLSRKAAVEFSFLLGLPVLLAAAGYDLLQVGFNFTRVEWSQIGIGILVSFIVARMSVNWLVSYVERRSLAIFGWYRIGLAVIYFTSRWLLGR